MMATHLNRYHDLKTMKSTEVLEDIKANKIKTIKLMAGRQKRTVTPIKIIIREPLSPLYHCP